MSATQWIVLAVAVAVVIAVYIYTRRDRRRMHRHTADEGQHLLLPPRDQQLDIFAGGEFDELGVGRPRRVTPHTDGPTASVPTAAAHGSSGLAATGRNGRLAPTLGVPRGTSPVAHPPPVAASPDVAAPVAPPAQAAVNEKIVSLLLAERDGAPIDGERLHAALRDQALEYGARQIYHRLHDGAPVFSVANLVKPGILDPQQAQSLHTPGVMLFMVLPGPQQPSLAIHDMLVTAGRLARALNGQVYDAKRKPLTAESGHALQLEIESWAAQQHRA